MGCSQGVIEPTLTDNILKKIMSWNNNANFHREANQVSRIINKVKRTSAQIDLIISFLQKEGGYYSSILSIIQAERSLKTLKNNIKILIAQFESSINRKSNFDVYVTSSSIFGSFLGDAMGSFCEFFQNSNSNSGKVWVGNNVFGLPRGHITDDSEMSLSLCFAIMDGMFLSKLSQHVIFFYYGKWFHSSPPDIGITIGVSLQKFNNNDSSLNDDKLFLNVKDQVLLSSSHSLSNGFLMRLSPLASWLYFKEKAFITHTFQKERSIDNFMKLYEQIKIESLKDTQVTHMNPEAASASAMYIFIILNTMTEESAGTIWKNLKSMLNSDEIKKDEADGDMSIKFIRCVEEIESTREIDPEKESIFSQIDSEQPGYYLHAIRLCLFYLWHFEEIKNVVGIGKMYRSMINSICNLGGDTDTNSCIVGGMLGALIGIDNFGVEVKELLSFVQDGRFIYLNGFAIIFIMFLKKYFSNSASSLTETEYPYRVLRIFLNLLSQNSIDLDNIL